MKSILLTRSVEDNHDIIKFLDGKIQETKKKFKYICSPLVEYKVLDFNPTILEDYSNIIITSKFATKLFVLWSNKYCSLQKASCLKKDIWVVGGSSDIILSENNFRVVYVAKNVQELIKNIPPEIYKQSVYLSSTEITQDLPTEITREIIYEVQYATQLYQLEEIKQGVDYVLLYSQNSAKTLIKLLSYNNLWELLSDTQFITISEKVAATIRVFTKKIVYCENANPRQMLRLLLGLL